MQPATLELSEAIRARTGDAMSLAEASWSKVGPSGDWGAQWAGALPPLVALVGAAQLGAAKDGAASVPAALEQSGFPAVSLGVVQPDAFTGWVNPAGTQSIPLGQYLLASLVAARMSPAEDVEAMLAAGLADLQNRTHFAIADAAGQATGAAITASKDTVSEWYDPPPYCQRCAVLIGKRVSVAFRRHPRCDGTLAVRHVKDRSKAPVMDIDQVKDLTGDQKRALADGADFNRVVNVKNRLDRDKRSRLSRDGRTSGQHLTPRGIYAIAGDDRDLALALLFEHGYIR